MLKRVLSYFVPINIYKKNSTLSKTIEVTWSNGQLVLDSKNTNYSYGSLQRILRKGLVFIGFDRVKSMEHVLILGVAGGSVIKTLIEEVKYKGKITGVELDPEIVEIGRNYFNLDKVPNLDLVIDDAFDFVLKTRDKYDLIIVDVFQDTHMPQFLFQKFFIDRLCFLLHGGGLILFNTMILKNEENERNRRFLQILDSNNYKTTAIPRVEQHNEVIIIEKLN
jgi:spermidine synthase